MDKANTIVKKHDVPYQYAVRITKDSSVSWKTKTNGIADLRVRAVGLNPNNEGFVEISIENAYTGEKGQEVSKYTSIQLTPKEAMALRDVLNSVVW